MRKFCTKLLPAFLAVVILSAVLNIAVCIHDNGTVHIVQKNIHQSEADVSPVSELISINAFHCVDISAEIEENITVANGNIELPKPEIGRIDLEWLFPTMSESRFTFFSHSKIPPDEIVRANIYNSIVSRLLI